MSLHIAHLSSGSRKDDLERIFQRYGRCEVRMKDGYGFVVYEYPPDAEVALRALDKTYACGQLLTLSWSNKQPRAVKRLARADRPYKAQGGRDPARRGDYGRGRFGSNDQQDYRVKNKPPDRDDGRHSSMDMRDAGKAKHQADFKDYVREERHGYREGFLDGHGSEEPNHVGNGRWGEQFANPPNGVENGIQFDRYDPYRAFDSKNADDNNQVAYLGSSPTIQNSQENNGRGHTGEVTLKRSKDAKFRDACYNCGQSGHKKRNCPWKHCSQGIPVTVDLKNHGDLHRRGRGEGELERFRSRSQENRHFNEDGVPTRWHKNDSYSSDGGKHKRMKSRSPPVAKETDRSQDMACGGTKRSRQEIESATRHSTKKGRRSVSSDAFSDCTASASHSKSLSSQHAQKSYSCKRSKSVSSRGHSLSSDSRSQSRYSRSKNSKYRSRSGSPTPLTVSGSVGGPLPSSSNKAKLIRKGFSDTAITPDSEEMMIEQGLAVEANGILEKEMVVVNNESTVLSQQGGNEMEENQLLQNNYVNHQVVSDERNSGKLPLGKGMLTAGTPESLIEMDHLNSDALMMNYVSEPKTDLEAPITSYSGHSTSITPEELPVVLKHYGFHLENDNEEHLCPGAYFGSARLWPWEIIYYRRLKKGPISVENYARRVNQNREFGIVDKYIRSSSGWGELVREKP